MRTRRTKKMWVVTVDENGKQKDGHWVDIPEPDHFASGGFAQVESYVSRLLQSSAHFSSVTMSTPDQKMAVSLWQRGGIPEFTLLVNWRSEAERESAIRQFFDKRGLAPSQDYLAGNGGVSDATRCLGYFVPPDARFIAILTKDVLREIYQLREQDALDFSFEEHPGAV